MKAIICDDEKATCSDLENLLLKYAKEKRVFLTAEVFYSGDTLLDYLKRERTDILFLDIELPGMDGVSVGKYIREIMEDDTIFLVYISSKEHYALQLFQNHPFDFLIKPLEQEKVYHVLDNIYRAAGKNNSSFEFQNYNDRFRIAYNDILYFQSEGRKINIVLKKEIKTFYGKLSEIEKRTPGNFLKIHKSYLINRNYVKEFTYEWVKMNNGDILNISKANRADVRRKILESAADEFGNI
ncbi:MAG TPA: LytTR family DNA-binding domain-containing protein [Candidatus Eisenbergiella stercoravium]|nr:LytTR family DNA-binding domain-containing protein [Candidatus Eisenbergiella stercoravium]